jgi:hypothetical protein
VKKPIRGTGALALVTILLALAHFALLLMVVLVYVRLHTGFRSFYALMTIIPMLGGAIVVVVGAGPWYGKVKTSAALAKRFLRATAIQMLLFPVIEGVRMLVMLPALSWDVLRYLTLRPVAALALAAVGVVLAIASIALAGVVPARLEGATG